MRERGSSMQKHPSYVAWLETATPEQITEDQARVEWLLDLARDPYRAPEQKSLALYELACRGIDPYADDPPDLAGLYDLRDSRALACLTALVEAQPGLAQCVVWSDGRAVATILESGEAGAGYTLLLEAWVNLYDGRPVDLRGVQMCDPVSMAALVAMLRVYRDPDG